MKMILTAEQLIEDMKKRGIRFEKIHEEDAIKYLTEYNYYMNVAAYRSNYSKCIAGRRRGEYQNLDFGYLVELSEIDTELKSILFSMCLDIERAIKTQIISHVSEIEGEDGYEIMRDFLDQQKDLAYLCGIRRKADRSVFCHDLIKRHYPYFPLWVFVELISFGTLIFLYSFYGEKYDTRIIDNKLMNIIRDVRNAAAHNNCMLNQISTNMDNTKQSNNEITQFVISIPGISDTSRKNNLRTKFTYCMVTLLYVYKKVIPEEIQKARLNELKGFMEGRVLENEEYFKNNSKLCSTYSFLKKVVDNLCA